MSELGHIPVLIDEVARALAARPGQTFVDCTAGLGGHAAMLAPSLAPGGRVVLNDADARNLARAEARVRTAAPGVGVLAVRGNFAELPHRLRAEHLRADMVLADLGFSSNQMDDATRGFSFSRDGPLDMRLDPTLPVTAANLVASMPEAELTRIIMEYGEDRNARRIASRIVRERASAPILTTSRLADVVRSATGSGGSIDPSTRTFQALRIAVNDELGCLEALLAHITADVRAISSGKAGGWLAPGCRLAVITFHSLEDRTVKVAFQECVRLGCLDALNGAAETSERERESNPRSRSAKVRCIELPADPAAPKH